MEMGTKRQIYQEVVETVAAVVGEEEEVPLHPLNTFLRTGVRPRYRPNELSDRACFYTTPSIAQAFVHPLFVKPRRHDLDPIILLRFDVDPRVLHGESVIAGSDSFATIKWYRGNWEEDVEEFIQNAALNLEETNTGNQPSVDVAIGPICVPGHNPSILPTWRNEADGHVTQVGCTEQMWLNSCLVAIYQEDRQMSPNP
ncbi:hypothetical protein C8J56DRAFT_1122857 [Mycena floridula]|nr:hypothetical protein C8J56DRAFT_1122857 [Mycena floridula]